MSDELKPCPFCGSQPIARNHYSETGGGDGHRCYVVECGNKACRVKVCSVACGPHGYPEGYPDDHPTNEAAEAAAKYQWNTRAAIWKARKQ